MLRKAIVPEPSRIRPLGWFGPFVAQLLPVQIPSLFGFRNKSRVVNRNCTDLRESAEREARGADDTNRIKIAFAFGRKCSPCL